VHLRRRIEQVVVGRGGRTISCSGELGAIGTFWLAETNVKFL